jgi:predicted transcriptional regulator
LYPQTGIPYWYNYLEENHALPKVGVKAVSSVIESLTVGVLETYTLKEFLGSSQLSIQPAKGVDIPEIELSIKSPSENYCTSEPFFSAYERLLGSQNDAIVFLTNYQTMKNALPLHIQIVNYKYLKGSQIADRKLCNLARKVRSQKTTHNETSIKKVIRFLAYVNKQDWRASKILKGLEISDNEKKAQKIFNKETLENEFHKQNQSREATGKELIPSYHLDSLKQITDIHPIDVGIFRAADDWVIETYQETARIPNENEWKRFLASPLDGTISISPALQWRYNFRNVFQVPS